jgi:hypothetical protein
MSATLTDRYVAAAMQTVPDKQRADLSAELRASIDDQIDARLEQGDPRAGAERAVLTALGDPEKLAAGYTDRPLHLIGPRYYLSWWRLLKLLWAIVPACAAFGVALGMVLAGQPVGGIIGTVAGVTVSVVVHVGFWTTFVFFLIERYPTGSADDALTEWTVDDLPEAPERRASLSDLIASLVFLGLATGAVLWDQLLGLAWVPSEGGWIPFLNPGLWPWGIVVLLVLIGLEALHAIWIYARGGWSTTAAGVNVALNLAVAVPAVVLLVQQRLLNPSFFPAIIPDDASGETVQTIVTLLIGFGVVAIAAWDSLDGFLKARRARRP